MRLILSLLILVNILFFSFNAQAKENSEYYHYSESINTMPVAVIDLDNPDKQEETKKNPYISLALSFFIPGAGQIYNEEYLKGIILFTGFVALTLVHFMLIEPVGAASESFDRYKADTAEPPLLLNLLIADKENSNKDELSNISSILEILALLGKIGIPSLWFYSWGTAYQSLDPVYIKQQEEAEKKKLEEEKKKNSASHNLVNIALLKLEF